MEDVVKPLPDSLRNLKVALVHEWLVGQGGGERVVYDLHTMFPNAPIYTLVYDEERAPAWCRDCDIRTTFLQKVPGAKRHHKMMLAAMPQAWEELDLTEFDLVISSCASCCKGVITRPDAIHICYCHSPIRYAWDLYHEYLDNMSPVKRAYASKVIHDIRQWDYEAAQRVDYFVANSSYVAKRIAKYYRRDATVIHPAITMRPPAIISPLGYYLVVSRFVRYKRVDIAIEACNLLGRKLIIASSGGEEEEYLRAIAGPTIMFADNPTDEDLIALYAGADAFLFPGIEDFGMTPIEAMAAGVPVLAYGEGGALETVQDKKTGLFFFEQTADSLAECIERFEQDGVSMSRHEISLYSTQFSKERFVTEVSALISEVVSNSSVRSDQQK